MDNTNINAETEGIKTKEKINIPKSAKIMIGVIVFLVIGFIIAMIIFAPRYFEKRRIEKERRDLINSAEVDYSDQIESINETSLSMYKHLLIGEYKANSTDADIKGEMYFNFREDGTFVGHTARDENDLGKWELSAPNGVVTLVTSVPDLKERYEIDFNNEGNVLLKCDDGSILILEAI